MLEPFLGMIALFGFNFAPKDWALCNGQLMSISQNSALFALLGTMYGGDGVTTFALPNLQGRVPLGMGNGPGLTPRTQGEMSGTENVTLLSTQMPQHNHFMTASGDAPTVTSPSDGSLGTAARGSSAIYVSGATTPVNMASSTSMTGGNQPHSNMQPYIAMNYCIALTGVFPQRS